MVGRGDTCTLGYMEKSQNSRTIRWDGKEQYCNKEDCGPASRVRIRADNTASERKNEKVERIIPKSRR